MLKSLIEEILNDGVLANRDQLCEMTNDKRTNVYGALQNIWHVKISKKCSDSRGRPSVYFGLIKYFKYSANTNANESNINPLIAEAFENKKNMLNGDYKAAINWYFNQYIYLAVKEARKPLSVEQIINRTNINPNLIYCLFPKKLKMIKNEDKISVFLDNYFIKLEPTVELKIINESMIEKYLKENKKTV